MNINNFQIYKAELPARQDQLSKIKSQLSVSKKGGDNWSGITQEETYENLENKFEKIQKLIQAEEEKNNDLAQQQTK